MTSYHISWKLKGDMAWGSEVTITTTGYTIDGLDSGAAYSIRLRAGNAKMIIYYGYIKWMRPVACHF